jgi:sugar fermentation stimulation protein A
VKSASGESRFDLYLQQHPDKPDCFVEVKSVTARADDGLGIFPDAVSARGKKHLQDLGLMVEKGYRAVLVFCVQRSDVSKMRAAHEIDAEYAQALKIAAQTGVEIYAYAADLTPKEVSLKQSLPVLID